MSALMGNDVAVTPEKFATTEVNLDTVVKPKTRQLTGIRWFSICVAIYSANFLYGLDNTIVADIQADISTTFNNVVDLGWLGSGFCLGCAVASFPIGHAYGLFDVKRIYISSLTMFAAASALCGAAPTMNAMIVGRVWAGAAGAGMYLGTLITSLCLPSEQPIYVGLIALVYGAGAILGPIVGGALADSAASWRWAFYINLLIVGIMFPIYLFVLPAQPRRLDLSVCSKMRSFDWLGICLVSAVYVLFALAFSMGGSRWAWNSASTVALIVLFGITAMIFAVSQHFRFFTTRQNRVFPAHFLKDWNLAGLFVSTACGIGSIFIAIYYVPLYFLFVHGESGTQAAIRMLPYVCTYITGVVACGLLLKRTGYPIIWYMASSIVLVIGSALWSTVNESTPMAATYGYSILVGFGMTTTQAGYSLGPQLAKNAADASNILRFLNIAQQSAQMMALVVASAIFQNLTFNNLKTILQGTGYSDSDIQAAMAGAKSQILQNVSPDLRDQCIRAIVSTIQKEWYIVIACSAVMLVQSAFFRRTRFYS